MSRLHLTIGAQMQPFATKLEDSPAMRLHLGERAAELFAVGFLKLVTVLAVAAENDGRPVAFAFNAHRIVLSRNRYVLPR